MEVEGWVDLGTIAVKVRSPCPKLHIAAAVTVNTTVDPRRDSNLGPHTPQLDALTTPAYNVGRVTVT